MRITGRQLRRIIQEEVERMMNEEGPDIVGLKYRGTKPIPRNVADDILEILNINLANATFDDESSPSTGALFTATIFNNRTPNVTPVMGGLGRGVVVGNTVTNRFYVASVGDIFIELKGPGGVVDSGVSEKDIEGDLKDLLTVYNSTIAPLVADGTKLTAEIAVKPKGAKFGSSQVDRAVQKVGTAASVSPESTALPSVKRQKSGL